MNNLGRKWGPKKPAAFILAVVVTAFALGYWLKGSVQKGPPAPGSEATVQDQAEATGQKRMLYVCPMMDIPPMEKSGKCPVCGMDLIQISGSNADDEPGPPTLQLSAEAQKLAAIQVVPVEKKFVSAEVRLFGQIEYDPVHLSYVSAFMPGLITRVYIERPGVGVRWGQPLFDLYSAELYYTQQELLEVVKYVPSFLDFQSGTSHVTRRARVEERKSADGSEADARAREAANQKLAAIRQKLAILGLSKKDLDEFMQRGDVTGIVTVYAPRSGTIIEQTATKGSYVNTGTPIFTIADPRYVWAKLDAYESDLPWIKSGQEVEFQTEAYPEEIFKGKVIFVDPIFDPKTRTFKVGVIATDARKSLRSQMLVRAVIHSRITADGKVATERTARDKAPLVIPASAPLITGKRAVVYLAVPGKEGTYEGREIVLGPRAKDHYLVQEGLEEGEMVVVNGSFKIDSALQILAKPSMMNIGKDEEAAEGGNDFRYHPETDAEEAEVPESTGPDQEGLSPWRGFQ